MPCDDKIKCRVGRIDGLEPGLFGSPFMFTGEPLDANGLSRRSVTPARGTCIIRDDDW
jgi:hypothetical protein